MSYYISSFSYSSMSSNGKHKKESSKGYAKSSNGKEEFFILDRENDKVLKDIKGERKNPKNDFNVIENEKKLTKTEKEVYNELIKANPSINPKYILDFFNSKEYKLLLEDQKEKIKSINNSVKNHINNSVKNHVNNSVKNHVNNSVKNHVNNSVKNHVNNSVKNHVNNNVKSVNSTIQKGG